MFSVGVYCCCFVLVFGDSVGVAVLMLVFSVGILLVFSVGVLLVFSDNVGVKCW